MSEIETLSKRLKDKTLSAPDKNTTVHNLSFGINLYKNAIDVDQCSRLIQTLDEELGGSGGFSWGVTDLSARSAADFEMSPEVLGDKGKNNKRLYDVNLTVLSAIRACIEDYSSSWDIAISHYEPLNFVKYSYPSTYFKLHIDHSPYNSRTVSAVAYLNDNYEGGELHFPHLDGLSIKPETGDIVVFPSTYLYRHESKEMLSGTKYSVAAMTDYSERG